MNDERCLIGHRHGWGAPATGFDGSGIELPGTTSERSWCRGSSIQPVAERCLTGSHEGLDEFSFATDGHAGKPFEPRTCGHLRLAVEPLRKQPEVTGGDTTFVHAM